MCIENVEKGDCYEEESTGDIIDGSDAGIGAARMRKARGGGTADSVADAGSTDVAQETEAADSSADTADAGDRGEPTLTTDGVGYDDATIEITWLAQEGFDSANQPVAEWQKERAIKFVKEHPEVRITLTASGTQINDAMAKLLTQAANGTAPDVACVDSFFLPQYYDYLQPIGDVLEKNNIPLDSWFPFAQSMMKPEDEVLAMWYDTDVRALYYRKDLVETPPKTWDELFAVMEPLKEEGYSFLYPAGKNETTSCDILPWFWGQGGEIFDDAGKPIFNEGANQEAMLNTFEFLKKTIDTGITPQRVTSFMTDGDMIEDIASGQVAMFVGGSWLATQVGAVIGQDAFNEMYGIVDVPYMEGGAPSTCCGGWTYGVFTKDETKRELAAQFVIDLYIGDEGNVGYTSASGNLPCRETSYDLSDRFKNDPNALAFREIFQNGHVRPAKTLYTYFSNEFQVALADVINGSKTPQEALDVMAANVDAEYAKQ